MGAGLCVVRREQKKKNGGRNGDADQMPAWYEYQSGDRPLPPYGECQSGDQPTSTPSSGYDTRPHVPLPMKSTGKSHLGVFLLFVFFG